MRHKLSTLIPKSRFLGRLAMLSGGTLAGQLVLVLASPLLTRLYDPAAFGILAVFSAVSAIFGMVMALRYEYAVPTCRDDGEAFHTIALSVVVALAMSLLVALLVWLFGGMLAARAEMPVLAHLLWLLPPALFVHGISLPLDFWSIRQGSIRINAGARLAQAMGQVIPQLALALGNWGGAGLVLGYALGYPARTGYFAIRLWRELRAFMPRFRPRLVLELARRHWRFPVFSSSSSLLQSSTQLLPAVFLAMLYGPAIAGWFALGQRIMGLPVRMLGQAASQIFLGEASSREGRNVHRLFMRTAGGFLLLGLVGMVPLLFIAPWLFAIVFGEGWREAGHIVQLLVPLHLARLVVMPISQVLNIFNAQSLHLLSALANVLALAGSFAAGWWWQLPAMSTIFWYSLGSTIAYLLYLAMAWRVSSRAAGQG